MVCADDWRGAYLHTKLGGPPVVAIMPDEVVPPEVKATIRRPCRRLAKAVYGGVRSGHDFDQHARVTLEAKF